MSIKKVCNFILKYRDIFPVSEDLVCLNDIGYCNKFIAVCRITFIQWNFVVAADIVCMASFSKW